MVATVPPTTDSLASIAGEAHHIHHGRTLRVCENVRAYAVMGDGSDETTTVQDAVTGAAGKDLFWPPGTYSASNVLVSSAQRWRMASGAVLKKKAGATTTVLTVTGASANLEIIGGEIDGNKANATGGGVLVTAASTCTMRGTYVHDSADSGILVRSSAILNGYDVRSDNHTLSGIFADTSALVVLDNACNASFNGVAGVFLLEGAADNCVVNGRYARNDKGVWLASDYGTSSYIYCRDNNSYGVYMGRATGAVTGWGLAYLETVSQGVTSGNGAATGLEMFGVQNSTFGTVNSRSDQGYGVAIVYGLDTATFSTGNRFGLISCLANQDPGVLFARSSSHNHIGQVLAKNLGSIAVGIGEGLSGLCTDNSVNEIVADGCAYGALRIENGAYNAFGRVISRDSYTLDGTYPGLISFATAATTGNIVGYIDERATGTKPTYVVNADANATANYVLGGMGRDYVTANTRDLNGGNFFTVS